MARVIVRIFHLDPGSGAGPFVRLLADARRANGLRRVDAFRAAGADEVELVAGPPDDTPFGRRLAELLAATQPAGRGDGIVVLGSGALPLATPRDHRSFVTAAGSRTRSALANNQYSADAIAISMPGALPPIPSMTADNALPRWLAERAGWAVTDLRGRWRLAVDLDSPLDVELVRPGALPAAVAVPMRDRRAAIRRAFHDRKAEVLVTGRTSAATLAWLERHTASRVRALVEERGLRAADPLAEVDPPASRGRPPTSVLGLLLDRDGPASLGQSLASLAGAALVDTRVLLAHRLGPDEGAWPSAEDRFASDLLDWGAVSDPWLCELTRSALMAPIPILLGGHTLVGPAARLVAGRPPRAA
ncbi:MAG: hypothetical protein E6I94_00045 [Chloroflexi bacterium]|nr:MAG: hypothetical protein E6I94_00045 [Chloroflexota bacterium]